MWKYRGILIIILIVMWLTGCGLDIPPTPVLEPKHVPTLPEKCAHLLTDMTGVTVEWSDLYEEYLPVNWPWRECMGVGQK